MMYSPKMNLKSKPFRCYRCNQEVLIRNYCDNCGKVYCPTCFFIHSCKDKRGKQ